MAEKPPLRPTVIGEVARPRRAMPQPTVMPGTTPTRLVPDMAALRGLDPQADEQTLRAAHDILSGLVADHLGPKAALFWGNDLQDTHRGLTAERLALSQDPLIAQTTTHLARLRDILSRIDLPALAGGGGLASRAFRSLSRLIDTPEELAAARREMDHLLRLLTAALDPLLAHREALARHGQALAALADKVAASALAAHYLAAHGPEAQRRAFTDRRSSLQATLVHLRASALHLANDTEIPARLILAVQNIALVALPAWMESLARLGHRPSLTEARDLAFRLADLIPLFPRTE